ncbi:hypothetical protein RRG08_018707 [Elysia crispata]|uniref:Uncharacterized protein n=1 Tax=Elysia crispata TaxID=231223 RepID=A0AAE0YG18_9GAST|nr:hypothetical protein RRG08_018707 [Elysia crispata]
MYLPDSLPHCLDYYAHCVLLHIEYFLNGRDNSLPLPPINRDSSGIRCLFAHFLAPASARGAQREWLTRRQARHYLSLPNILSGICRSRSDTGIKIVPTPIPRAK